MAAYINIQIQFPTHPGPATLQVHENNGYDLPACGEKLRNWTDPKGVRHNGRFVVVDLPANCTRPGCV